MERKRLSNSPIVYYVSGTNHQEWVLLLHAAFVDHNMFRRQVEYFQDRYNVLTLDIIGHGSSTETKRGDSVDHMSLWIADILREERIEKIHMAGVSLGAALAQDFANKYPEKVKSLACFGGYDINHFDSAAQKKNGGAQSRMMLRAVFSVKWFAQGNRKISAYTPQAQQEFFEMNRRFPKKSFLYLASLNSMVNAHPGGPRPYPLLIGCGRHDIPGELSNLEQWKAREPDCEMLVFENAGHCVNMDVPEKFNAALEKFWASAK